MVVILSITCTLPLGKGDNQSLSCAVQNSPLSNCSIRDHCGLGISFAICPALEEGMCVLSGYCVTYDSRAYRAAEGGKRACNSHILPRECLNSNMAAFF